MQIKNLDKLPNSNESEQSILGGLLLNNEAWEKVVGVMTGDDFFKNTNRIIFNAIATLLEQNKPADILTVKEQLKKTNNNQSDLFAYLAQMANNTPSIYNIEAYAKHVRELSVYRQLIKASNEIASIAHNPKDIEIQELIDEAESKIFAISEQIKKGKKDIINLKDIKQDISEQINKWQKNPGLTGLETGFIELDNITSGLQNSDLIILAGRPSMGKTSLAMNIVNNVAIKQNKPVIVFSLEMSVNQLALRLISSFGHININSMRNNLMSEKDWSDLAKALNSFDNSDILIDETPAITPTEIKAKCRRIKRKYKDLALIVVDYLQLMTAHGKNDNRVQEMSEISRSLKVLAKDIDVPVLALSQLNRAVESRRLENKGRMPQMADLRESGSIEQDADIIAFIYRDEQYHDESYTNPDEIGKADIKIAKHRNGPTGSLKLAFVNKYTSFENLAYTDQGQSLEDMNNYHQNIDDYDRQPF
jgi:replicative DNA helicase